MDARVALSRPARRLHAELVDDGVVMEVDEGVLGIVLDELEYARRPPVFERRTPLYGSIVVPGDRSLIESAELVDLLDVDMLALDDARRFADGRSTYLVRQPDQPLRLACFRRSVQYEADLVEIESDIGGIIVQRTPVLGVTRAFTPPGTVEWSGYRWSTRPNARTQHAKLQPKLPGVARPLLEGLLELAIHWLSPARVGATLVLVGHHGDAGLDLQHSQVAPELSITTRYHYPALFAALMQTDLATLVDASGTVRRLGVGLRASPEAGTAVDDDRGMRHRSAAGYTYDQPGAVAVVVSEDGPVTVFARGDAVSECSAGAQYSREV
ncbi:MAG TPA: DNA integrity scanning protein DisA nucleotide-binding domain protein [Acidimicrobiales bacterium]|nr:DNA integrity scanning protein DisA nucleotide-binding domain protein [Acidimicrobiales bacterium]